LTGVSIQVRELAPNDIDDLEALAIRAWRPVHESMAAVLGDRLNARIYPDWAATQATDVRAACTDPAIQVSVAVDCETVVGFVAVFVHADGQTGEVDMIAVDPSAQRRGVGQILTDYALTQIRGAGCDLAVIATGGDAGHAPARALYESAGFTPLPLVRYYRQL
jgi:ribosomal protein S18 acetylase RimI-like enzyme